MNRKYFHCIALSSILLMTACGSRGDSGRTETEVLEEKQGKVYAKIYDDAADPVRQIDEAVALASASGRNVIAQVGGNWCKWCLMFADFISSDEEISDCIGENFIYIHVNVNHKNENGRTEIYTEAMEKLGNPMRFGYPVLVVLDGKGNVIHTQDSSYLEEDGGYDRQKVMRFFRNWSPVKRDAE